MPEPTTVTELNDLLAASRAVKRRYEGDAYLNLSFLVGDQWTSFDGTRIWEPPVDDAIEKVTDNRIEPFVRTEIAKMTKTRPKPVAIPRTQSDRDIAAARFAEDALEDAWRRFNLQRKLRRALLWSRTAFAGFWKVWWDPAAGPMRDVLLYGEGHPQAGKLIRDQYGAPMAQDALPAGTPFQQTSVARGEICVELRSFFEVYPDALAGEEGIESAEHICEEAVYSEAYADKHFPKFAGRFKADSNPQAGVAEARMPFPLQASGAPASGRKGVILREYWSLERHIVWAPSSEMVVLDEPNPYPWLPYVMFTGIAAPGRFWPDCVVNHLRPRQVDLNKRLSQIAGNAERQGNPPLMVPSTMSEEFVWENLPGQQITYPDTGSPTAMPSFLAVPEIPAYVQNDVDRIQNSMQEISGQHEVTGASVPAGVTAASAISQLQEADDTRLGPDIQEMETTLAEAGKRLLWLMRRYYEDGRLVRVAGRDGWWNIRAWKSDALEGVDDIDVQSGSGMPQSQAAKQAAIQQMATLFAQSGQAISERQWRRILMEMQVGGLEQFFADVSRDEQQVNDENRRLSLGESLQINSYDDDHAHVDGHTDWMKTSEFAELKASKPDAVKNAEQHLLDHRNRISQMAPPAPVPAAGNGAGPPAAVPSPMSTQPSPQ